MLFKLIFGSPAKACDAHARSRFVTVTGWEADGTSFASFTRFQLNWEFENCINTLGLRVLENTLTHKKTLHTSGLILVAPHLQ